MTRIRSGGRTQAFQRQIRGCCLSQSSLPTLLTFSKEFLAGFLGLFWRVTWDLHLQVAVESRQVSGEVARKSSLHL